MALEQPKKPAGGAYGQFMNEKRAEFTKQLQGKPVSEVAKLGGSIWKAMSEADKAPYQKKFEDAKAKYEKDFAAFIAAGGVKTKGVTALRAEKRKARAAKQAKKDPLKPKKPAGGAYGCFLAKHRPAFMKECQGQSVTAVTKLASAKWKALSEAEKAPFEEEYETKRKAYFEAMKSYVPPAGAEAKEDEDEDDDDAEEEEEEEEEDEEEEAEEEEASPPSKKARKAEAPPAKKEKTTHAMVALSDDILAEAKNKGLDLKLKAMMRLPKVVEKKINAKAALKALEQADGKAVAAKKALFGA